MAVREILLLGNPLLRAKCEMVKSFLEPSLHRTIRDLHDTLEDFKTSHDFGRGIAAPQIGVTKRIIFINVDRPLALVNPVIVRRSRRRMTLWDDCFSFPDIMVKIKRHFSITVSYCEVSGAKLTFEATGGLSELLQHEIDHLNGVLAIDRAIDSTQIILRSEWKKLTDGANNKDTV